MMTLEKVKLGQQIRALTASIDDKWRPICDGSPMERFGLENCACCVAYYDSDKEVCGNCPIKEDTEINNCAGTPIIEIELTLRTHNLPDDIPRKNHPDDLAELAYLCHLRRRLHHKLYDLMTRR